MGANLAPTILAMAALVAAFGTAIAAILTARGLKAVVRDSATTVGAAVADVKSAQTTNAEANVKNFDAVKAQADVITGHVNSAAAASAAKIDSLEKQVSSLVQQLVELKQTAALLAQSQVVRQVRAEDHLRP
jgi:hypothetical protein